MSVDKVIRLYTKDGVHILSIKPCWDGCGGQDIVTASGDITLLWHKHDCTCAL